MITIKLNKKMCVCVCRGWGGGYETRLRVLAFTLGYDFPYLLHSKSSFVPTQLKDIIFASIGQCRILTVGLDLA